MASTVCTSLQTPPRTHTTELFQSPHKHLQHSSTSLFHSRSSFRSQRLAIQRNTVLLLRRNTNRHIQLFIQSSLSLSLSLSEEKTRLFDIYTEDADGEAEQMVASEGLVWKHEVGDDRYKQRSRCDNARNHRDVDVFFSKAHEHHRREVVQDTQHEDLQNDFEVKVVSPVLAKLGTPEEPSEVREQQQHGTEKQPKRRDRQRSDLLHSQIQEEKRRSPAAGRYEPQHKVQHIWIHPSLHTILSLSLFLLSSLSSLSRLSLVSLSSLSSLTLLP
eukprot:TRINITY_DN635_c0_g3_i2.p1 TRINITY_DN635_c0_g3~~TRINITY_DN635_c0_g3_i2.p1  ORF type:complete len:273 (-),score=46.78 TRINITY_DN635_c0_g3_i2:138-956(-)